MRNLIASFSLPWYVWTIFGFFIGGLLVSATFKNEFVKFIARMLNWKEK